MRKIITKLRSKAATPILLSAPSIPGTPQVGTPVTAVDAVWNGSGITSHTYQWKAAGVNATGAGATTLTYTPASGDLGDTLTITTAAANGGGTSAPSTSGASAAVIAASGGVPTIITAPAITAAGGVTPTVGVLLTVSNGSWTGAPTSWLYQWQNEGSNIPGATGSTYMPVSGDHGALITCMVTAQNGSGASIPSRSNLAGPVIGTTVRYVSFTDGLDTNDGTTSTPGAPHGPWKTIAHVNAQIFAAGTSVLFKRGDKWDRSGGPTVTGTIFPANAGTSGHPIVYDAYGNGVTPIIDGSADASSTSDWTSIGTNLWQSVQTFAPIPGQTQGLPYFNANDVGNVLWNFKPLGGSAPPTVMDASFGRMVGGGVGGVWYKPGNGTANLGTTQGNWNFNTDNNKVQIYSVGNPATAMPGLRLVLDGGGVLLQSNNSYTTFQNFTFQNIGASVAFVIRCTNTICRDCVFQWIGGGNIGGGSNNGSRAGDGFEHQNTWSNSLIERNYFYQMYDLCISPQEESSGAHDNVTFRNNICNTFQQVWGSGLNPSGSGNTQNGWFMYNNTAVGNGVSSWSVNQRPNGSAFCRALESIGPYSNIIVSNSDIRNNTFTGNSDFGVIVHPQPNKNMSIMGMTWDNNNWTQTGGKTMFGDTGGSGNITMASWSSTYGFDTHGLIDISPSFTTSKDFTPTSASPLRNAGANLFSKGVVWDFNKNPRPASGPFTIGAIQ